MHGHTLRPKQDVAIGQRQPEVIFAQLEQDRIVQDTAFGIGDQDIFALPHGHGRQVARGQHLGELRGIRSGDLNLTFNSHVAQDRVVYKVPEVLFGVAKIARDIHMVIHRETLRAPTYRRVEVRGFANLSTKAKVLRLHHVLHPHLRFGLGPRLRCLLRRM